MVEKINAALLRDMFAAGAALLEENKAGVDAMNVFPVPDGDTGTNMSMTLNSAVNEMRTATEDSVKAVSAAMARGALRGARGNSGVISSQIFRGFAKGLADVEEADTAALANAFQTGVKMAYKAVMKPREGTILTVAKAAADAAVRASRKQKDLSVFMQTVIDAANDMLNKTPDMLPVLKRRALSTRAARVLSLFIPDLSRRSTAAESSILILKLPHLRKKKRRPKRLRWKA